MPKKRAGKTRRAKVVGGLDAVGLLNPALARPLVITGAIKGAKTRGSSYNRRRIGTGGYSSVRTSAASDFVSMQIQQQNTAIQKLETDLKTAQTQNQIAKEMTLTGPEMVLDHLAKQTGNLKTAQNNLAPFGLALTKPFIDHYIGAITGRPNMPAAPLNVTKILESKDTSMVDTSNVQYNPPPKKEQRDTSMVDTSNVQHNPPPPKKKPLRQHTSSESSVSTNAEKTMDMSTGFSPVIKSDAAHSTPGPKVDEASTSKSNVKFYSTKSGPSRPQGSRNKGKGKATASSLADVIEEPTSTQPEKKAKSTITIQPKPEITKTKSPEKKPEVVTEAPAAMVVDAPKKSRARRVLPGSGAGESDYADYYGSTPVKRKLPGELRISGIHASYKKQLFDADPNEVFADPSVFEPPIVMKETSL